MIDPRLLAAVGIDTSLPAAQQAAHLVRRMPLRWQAPAGSRDITTVLESRWFAGSAECHRVLGQFFRGNTGRGSAFGTTWPFLEVGGRVAAPALPAVVGSAEEQGPDGCYQVSGRTVWREAIGERSPLLELGRDQPMSGRPFDLLWFGSSERYVVSEGILEIEDLFSSLRVEASSARLEAFLVRGMRVDGRVLEGLAPSAVNRRPEIEVRRPFELVAGERVPTPEDLLGGRAGVRRAGREGDEIALSTEDDRRVVFNVEQGRDGWRVYLWDGEFPYQSLTLRQSNQHLSLTAALGDGLNPFAPGVRGQVAFDLRSDLIALD